MGNELDFKRIEENHYTIEGNNEDVLDVIKQFETCYTVEIINSEVKDVVDKSDDIDWVFTPRAELRWYDQITPAEYEIKLHSK